MNNDNKTDKPTWESAEMYLATEIISQSKAHARHWFITWLITFLLFIVTNGAWIYVFQSYDYVNQEGTGLNSINTGTQGDLINEPESQN